MKMRILFKVTVENVELDGGYRKQICRIQMYLHSGCCLTVGCLEADKASWQWDQE